MRTVENLLIAVCYAREISTDRFNPNVETKRWQQVKGMFLSLYSKQDLYNFYGYGCYCLNLGDRPMSGSTFGRSPVDEKDRHCYDLQQCNKCAKIEHGSQCLSELTNYQYEVSNGQITCKNAGGCKRAICECDKRFVELASSAIASHNPVHSVFGTPSFDWDLHCSPPCGVDNKPACSGGGGVTHQCCGNPGSKIPYNPAQYDCCTDGKTAPTGTC